VAEPAPDHVDLDAGLEQVHGRRVPNDVGPDAADIPAATLPRGAQENSGEDYFAK
jgi:hypothetical protein